jgi:hypothetical protein
VKTHTKDITKERGNKIMATGNEELYRFYEEQIPGIDSIGEEMQLSRAINNAYMCDYLTRTEFEDLDDMLHKRSRIAIREGAMAAIA